MWTVLYKAAAAHRAKVAAEESGIDPALPSVSKTLYDYRNSDKLTNEEKKRLDTISQRNDCESPLLRLPGELRNRIYSYMFIGDIYFSTRYESGDIHSNTRYELFPPTYSDGTKVIKYTALFGVCHKLYTEAAMLPITSTLVFASLHSLSNFVTGTTSGQRAKVTSMRIKVEGDTASIKSSVNMMMREKGLFADLFLGQVKVKARIMEKHNSIDWGGLGRPVTGEDRFDAWFMSGGVGNVRLEWIR